MHTSVAAGNFRWSRRHFLAAITGAPLAYRVPAAFGADRQGLPILAYHRFDPRVGAPFTVSLRAFEAQLDWLDAHGCHLVALRDAVAQLRMPKVASAPTAAALTVDDGHLSVYTQLFPIIRRHRLPVTLFIYPSAISNASYAMTWDQLREVQASGWVEVQSHTYWHPNFKTERRKRTAASFATFVDDQLQRSRQVLEARLGSRVDLLAWPFGIVDAELEAAARRAGYHAAFGYPGGPARPRGDRFAIPRIAVSDGDRGARFGALLGLAGDGAGR